MIGHLTGVILHQDLKSVVLDVNGVGYKIFTNISLLPDTASGPVSFWTYLAVRENALDLYGFGKKEELDFFELLLTVSGIGPKSAMGILHVSTLNNLRQAISNSDTSHLTKVSGIGKKVAEKIVLELQDKLGVVEGSVDYAGAGDMDALEALKALGYSERDARDALKKATGENTEAKIRSALKNLNK